MNIEEVKALDDGDLQVQVDRCRKELFNLRVKAATESIDNPREIRSLRHDVARLLTERRRRDIEGSQS